MIRSNAKFKVDLSAFVARANGNIDQVVRKVALDILRALVLASPVDTGRFRGNWFVQLDTAPQETSEVDDRKTGTAGKSFGQILGSAETTKTVGRGYTQIARFKIGDSLYILNHLPYSIELEYGSSRQAPNGMVRITAAEFDQYVRSAAAGLKK